MCVFKCIHVCLCATYMPVPVCQKSEVDALDLDYQLLSATLWVLGTEVGGPLEESSLCYQPLSNLSSSLPFILEKHLSAKHYLEQSPFPHVNSPSGVHCLCPA